MGNISCDKLNNANYLYLFPVDIFIFQRWGKNYEALKLDFKVYYRANVYMALSFNPKG